MHCSLEVKEVGVVVPVIHGAPPVCLLMGDELAAVLALRRGWPQSGDASRLDCTHSLTREFMLVCYFVGDSY